MVDIITVTGESIGPYLLEAARLRIEVFREFPYLYDGAEDYERDYLSTYSRATSSIIVLAIRNGRVVGVSTGLAMVEADEAFQKPFLDSGRDLTRIFYFGESVLAAAERGQGIGHRFFDEREKYAQELGYGITTFCAVERPEDHPLRPTPYRSNETFWKKRGYVKHPELRTELEWRQIDQPEDVRNQLIFWTQSW